jgi:hypothetical protein
MVPSIIVRALLVFQVFSGFTSALDVSFLSSTCDTFTVEVTLTPAEYNQGEFIAIVPTGTGISAGELQSISLLAFEICIQLEASETSSDEYSSNAITDFFTSTSLDDSIVYTLDTPLVPTSSDPTIQVLVRKKSGASSRCSATNLLTCCIVFRLQSRMPIPTPLQRRTVLPQQR